MSFLKADDFDIVSLCYVPDDGTLGYRETLHVELKGRAGPGQRLESHWARLLV